MSLRTTVPVPLHWDPTDAVAAGETSHFVWAVDHAQQGDPTWCWAACLSNALTCFGRFVQQRDIVDRFFTDHGAPPATLDDQRIPSPELVLDLWSSYGFGKPSYVDGQLPFDELAHEIDSNGPVQIELWKKDTPNDRHLALIFGFTSTANDQSLLVSDPESFLTGTYSYNLLKDTDALGSKLGEWRRTYLNKGFQRGYLRRFFGQPTEYLADAKKREEFKPSNESPPTIQAVSSKLRFGLPPNPAALQKELSLAGYGYRCYRYRSASKEDEKDRWEDLKSSLFLLESIPIGQPPAAIQYEKSLKDQLQPGLWHHQIFDSKAPRYYAHTQFSAELQTRLDSGWRAVWMGERWMAERVNSAVEKLDSDFSDHDEEVRMMWIPRLGLVTLYLVNSDLQIIVSANTQLQKTFPLLGRFTDEGLRKVLEGLLV